MARFSPLIVPVAALAVLVGAASVAAAEGEPTPQVEMIDQVPDTVPAWTTSYDGALVWCATDDDLATYAGIAVDAFYGCAYADPADFYPAGAFGFGSG